MGKLFLALTVAGLCLTLFLLLGAVLGWGLGSATLKGLSATRQESLSDKAQHNGDRREQDGSRSDDNEKPEQNRPAHLPHPHAYFGSVLN